MNETEVKKIYYVANMRAPTERAHGIQTAKMCEAFKEAGFSLELIVPSTKSTQNDFSKFYNLRCDIPIKQVFSINLFPKTRIGFNLRALVFGISSFLYLRSKLKKEKGVVYVIDHDQFSFSFLVFLNTSVFAEIHGPKINILPNMLFFKRVSGIIAVSRGVSEGLIEDFSVSPDRIIVCPNGIDISSFDLSLEKEEARKQLKIAKEGLYAIYVGKFYDWKGLEIFPYVASKIPDIKFFMIGGSAEEFGEVSGVTDYPSNLIFGGSKPHSEIPVWLKASDILLVSGTKKNQYSYRETSPMKIFEYMVSMRPIVAADTPAIRSIVTEKEVFLYKPDDHQDLEKVIKNAVEDLETAKIKMCNSYKLAKDYSWSNRVNTIVKFFKK